MRTPKKILIAQPGLIGDCILTLPLVRSLKRHFKPASIDLWAHKEYAGFLHGRSDIDCVEDLSSVNTAPTYAAFDVQNSPAHVSLINRLTAYDLIVAFVHKRHLSEEVTLRKCAQIGSGRLVASIIFMPAHDTHAHITAYHFEQYNEQIVFSHLLLPPDLTGRFIFPRTTDVKEIIDGLHSLGIKLNRPIVFLHPGAGVSWKKWHMDNFQKLASCLTTKGFQVLWIQGPSELTGFSEDQIKTLLTYAPGIYGWPLERLCGLFSQISLYIGNDSGITHLAAACGCPTVSIFGPTNETLYRPIGPCVTTFRPSPESFKKESEADVCALMNMLSKLRSWAGKAFGPASPSVSSMPGPAISQRATSSPITVRPASSAGSTGTAY